MNYLLLNWNPKKIRDPNLLRLIEKFQKDKKKYVGTWSISKNRLIPKGERIFLVRLGEKPIGIIASGYAIPNDKSSEDNVIYQGERWPFLIDVEWDMLLDFDSGNILPLTDLKEKFPEQMWTPQMSGIIIKDGIGLEKLWEEFTGNEPKNAIIEEIDRNKFYIEGLQKRVNVNKYERNYKAAQKAKEYWGYNCMVCGINFKDFYGLGENFIIAHHIIPVSSRGKQYKINPIEDFRTVCPNCHSIAHMKEPPYTIEELKEKINQK